MRHLTPLACAATLAMLSFVPSQAATEDIVSSNSAASATQDAAAFANTEAEMEFADPTQEIPCPSFWQVRPNPSVENSLSYVHDSGKLAISVTYISDQSGSEVSAETFSRVAAEQMNCTLPVKSNLLNHAWAFNCDDGLEALVYGEPGNLVLLSISGRNEETENYLDGFISFLSYQSRRN